MLNIIGTALTKRTRANWRLPCLLCALTLAGAALAGPSQTGAGIPIVAAGTTYRVINLGAGQLVNWPYINSKGQVAYVLTADFGTYHRALFYDGNTIEDIDALVAPSAGVSGLNDEGQLVGAYINPEANVRAYVWSRKQGLIDLGTLPGANEVRGAVINNRGEVAANSTAEPQPYAHAVRWSLSSGMEYLGAFTSGADSTSQARAINDAGLIAGDSMTASYAHHAFAWTRTTGMIDIDTLGSRYSTPVAVGAKGQVAGNFFLYGGHTGVFMWTPAGGMRDLGSTGRDRAWMVAMNASGQIVGVTYNDGEFVQAMTWTQESGMVDLGTLGGHSSSSISVNNKGQVVGGAATGNDEYHAFIWTAKDGMTDLNQLVRNAPAGFKVFSAYAISDNGSIVAYSNAGAVLLTPWHGRGAGHAVGPIAAAGVVKAGVPFDASVSFAAEDHAAKHNVIWSWGDGSGELAGNTIARNGAGRASGSHTYTTPGIYMVTAKVTDLAGNSAAVSRTIVAEDQASGFSGGAGAFVSPHLPNKKASFQAGMATFSFVAPSITGAKAISEKGQLNFNVGALSFRSKDLRALGTPGQFAGSGTINGTGNYQFSMAATPGAGIGQGTAGSFGLKIWHVDPATGMGVVDYDNRRAGSSATGRQIIEGMISGH